MIEVENLIFEYPGHRAIDDVSFSIERDSVTALVGPNGAGKTTLMRCLCGLERPLSGVIVIDGIDVVDHPRRCHERIGYLSDFYGLYDDLDVSQCLRHAAEANGTTRNIHASVRETADRLNLGDRLNQRVGELSRGLRQRVAVGQALIHNPRVLILDEPASGLDPEARQDLAELFKDLQAGGMTLLVSSHILAELEEYASEMLVIRDGRIIEQRKLHSAAASHRELMIEVVAGSDRVKDLLGARAETHSIEVDGNRIRCRISGGDEVQQRLLKNLVEAGIAIVNFTIVERDLQRSYLDSIKEPSTK